MSPKKRSRASSSASDDHKPLKQFNMDTNGGVGASSSGALDNSFPASGPLVHASQDLDDFQASFWRYQMDLVEQGGDADGNIVDFKSGLPTQGQLPLARIKKVMKSDDQVKMISAEAPILFARACEIFISDLTCRAFLIAEEHKRRTIQRSDIAGAIGRSDLFDFLIDIVPRHESVPSSRLPGGGAAKREKTGEGKSVGRSSAAASASRRQQQDGSGANEDHLFSGGYGDADPSAAAAVAEAAATASDLFNIPHTAVDGAHSSSMANWIHDTSADEHSSQPDLHHAQHSHQHTHQHSAPHTPHDHHQQQHHGHHHAAQHHVGGHHSHHHSPLDYVTPSNAGTPSSIGAGSASGGGGAWSHTFSGF